MRASFEWDEKKNKGNLSKHDIDFDAAKYITHSKKEKRYYCFGKVKGGVLTVRFTYRTSKIRIIGAGFWRKGKAIYEKQNTI